MSKAFIDLPGATPETAAADPGKFLKIRSVHVGHTSLEIRSLATALLEKLLVSKEPDLATLCCASGRKIGITALACPCNSASANQQMATYSFNDFGGGTAELRRALDEQRWPPISSFPISLLLAVLRLAAEIGLGRASLASASRLGTAYSSDVFRRGPSGYLNATFF